MPKTTIDQLPSKKFVDFHKDAASAVKAITVPGFNVILVDYEEFINNLDANNSITTVTLAEAASAKKDRDQAYVNFRHCVKDWCVDENKHKRMLGKALWKLVGNFTRIDHMYSDDVTHKIEDLLPQIRELTASRLYAPLYRGSIIEYFYIIFETAESRYVTASMKHAEALYNREHPDDSETRDKCMDKFNKIKESTEIMAEYGGSIPCHKVALTLAALTEKYCA